MIRPGCARTRVQADHERHAGEPQKASDQHLQPDCDRAQGRRAARAGARQPGGEASATSGKNTQDQLRRCCSREPIGPRVEHESRRSLRLRIFSPDMMLGISRPSSKRRSSRNTQRRPTQVELERARVAFEEGISNAVVRSASLPQTHQQHSRLCEKRTAQPRPAYPSETFHLKIVH
eukprot:104488-Prymnesium_polylepis.1